MHPAVALTVDLMARPSVTPDQAGCHQALREVLAPAGFQIQDLPKNEVANLFATHGTGSPLTVFAGHCDVVPPGPLDAWQTAPFDPTIIDGTIYGRGAADMKSGLAALTVALAQFVKSHPDHPGTVALLSTSDEEGAGLDGTKHVLEHLAAENFKIDYALVGEPTSEQTFGDILKVGRRGSITGTMTVKGIQGHVAYPHLADNPIHRLAPFLTELTQTQWDNGNEVFPPTSLQIANLNSGTGAVNVIPGLATLDFNIRFSPESTPDQLIQKIEQLVKNHRLDATIDWVTSAYAFQTKNPDLVQALHSAIQTHTGQSPAHTTGGGTSDARFFAQHNIPVVEFGPLNKTIHASNEQVTLKEVETLTEIYRSVLESLHRS